MVRYSLDQRMFRMFRRICRTRGIQYITTGEGYNDSILVIVSDNDAILIDYDLEDFLAEY